MSIARNTLLNMAGIGVPIIVSIVTVPLYLHAIGLERYGILSICWVAIAYFALFDFGVGKALAQRMAAAAGGLPTERNALFWTGISTSIILAVAAALLSLAVATYELPRMAFETTAVAREAQVALPVLTLIFPTIIIGGALNNVLAAHERFGAINLIEIVSNTLGMVAPVLAAYSWGPELPKMLTMILGARLLAIIAMAICCWKTVPISGFVWPRLQEVMPLLRYGGWASLSDATTPILSVWDRIAIGMVLGAAAVPLYSIPNTLVTRLTLLPAALSRSLFPRLARATSTAARNQADIAIAGLASVMTPLCLIAMLGAGPFLYLWIGAGLANQVEDIAYILIPGLWMNALAVVPYTLVLAQRRPQVSAWIHAGQVLPYVLALYLVMVHFGILGVAVLWTVRAGFDALLFLLFAGVSIHSLRLALPGLALTIAAAAVAVVIPQDAVLRWLLLTTLLLAGCFQAWFSAPEVMRSYCRALFSQLRRIA